MHTIIERAIRQPGENPPKVRLIIVDHVMPKVLHNDFRWGEIEGGRSAQLANFKARYLEETIEVTSEKDNSEFLRSIISKSASLGDRDFEIDHPAVIGGLEHLDRMSGHERDLDAVRHPLFAALMGQAIRESDDSIITLSTWSRRDLIDYYFEGRDRFPWTGWTDFQDKEHRVQRGLIVGGLVAAATLLRGLSVSDFEDILTNDQSGLVQRANSIVSFDSDTQIREFLPDILGEAFLLKLLQAIDSEKQSFKIFHSILQNCSKETALEASQNFRETIARTARNLGNDNPSNSDVIKSWRALQRFLDPTQFLENTAIRFSVSYAIADVLEALFSVVDRLEYRTENSQPSLEHSDLATRYRKIILKLKNQFSIADMKLSMDQYHIWETTKAIFKYFDLLKSKKLTYEASHLEFFVEKFKETFENIPAFMIAALDNRYNILDDITSHLNEDLSFKWEGGWSAAHDASIYGHLNILEYLEKNEINIHGETDNGLTTLMAATGSGQIKVVEYLINRGANVNAKTSDNHVTALMIAAEGGYYDIVKILKSAEADVFARRSDDGTDAFFHAIKNSRLEIAEYLKTLGVDVNGKILDNSTAAFAACMSNDEKTVCKYVELGGGFDIQSDSGATPALICIQEDWIRAYKAINSLRFVLPSQNLDDTELQLIIQKDSIDALTDLESYVAIDADHILSQIGRTLLQQAVGLSSLRTLEWLLDKGADVNKVGTYGKKHPNNLLPALHLAAEKNDVNVLKKLLDVPNLDIDCAMRISDGMTALMFAAQNNSIEILKMIRQRSKANIDFETFDTKATALLLAAERGHLEAVEYLLSEGANPNHTTNTLTSPLHQACREGFLECVKVMLDSGADPNHEIDGLTPLAMTINHEKNDVIKLLFDKGADPNKKISEKQFFPVTVAASKPDHNRVCLLLEKGASWEGLQMFPATQRLLYATMIWNKEKIVSLINSEEIDASDHEINRTLRIAGSHGDTDVMELLLQYGANPNQPVICGTKGVEENIIFGQDNCSFAKTTWNELKFFTKMLASKEVIVYPIAVSSYFRNDEATNLLQEWGADPQYICKPELASTILSTA